MDQQEFVDAIKIAVKDAAASDALKVLQNPPGRRPAEELRTRSEWYKSLDEDSQRILASIVADVAERAAFGFLCILDGVRSIEEGGKKGKLELRYLKDDIVNLTPSEGPMLHDLW